MLGLLLLVILLGLLGLLLFLVALTVSDWYVKSYDPKKKG